MALPRGCGRLGWHPLCELGELSICDWDSFCVCRIIGAGAAVGMAAAGEDAEEAFVTCGARGWDQLLQWLHLRLEGGE